MGSKSEIQASTKKQSATHKSSSLYIAVNNSTEECLWFLHLRKGKINTHVSIFAVFTHSEIKSVIKCWGRVITE